MLLTALLAACSGGGRSESTSVANGASAIDATWGGAVKYPPVAWPSEPTPSQCGDTCGEWLPYTRFQHPVKDPRTQDPSNGGTAPQNYVNVSSSCTDTALPSVYYALHRDPNDATKDVIFFRWRVEQPAHTYATGPAAGSYGASDPWSSALWTVLFDIDGSGYRQLAAHSNGSSGSPSAPIDTLAGIYGRIPTQSIDYLTDPANITLLGTSPTAFVDDQSGAIMNFRNSVSPTPAWPNGSSETTWDYGATRARLVSTRPCTEYFVDYQIPVAMLNARAQGGPEITRSTPISMLFCTANSLNNPLQKDCALNRKWNADAASPGPFGDYISFDQTAPYAQPIISKVTSTPPSSCSGTYTFSAQVQDSLYVNDAGRVVPSVKAVSFWYYYDANGDGIANDGGSVWTFAADASLVPGQLNKWTASWDGRSFARGNYLIGAQAVDDNRLVDDGMTPSGVDIRTFSYATSDSLGQVYVNQAWQIDPQNFPPHSPALSTSTSENWYGNPLITGLQVSAVGVSGVEVDLALNLCGVGPTLSLAGTPTSLGPQEAVSFSVLLSNTGNPRPTSLSSISVQLPPGFTYVGGSTSGVFGSLAPAVNGATLTWTPGASVVVEPGGTRALSFSATATSTTGQYNAAASAQTSDGSLTSDPTGLTVYAAATTLTNTPSRYAVPPDGTTQVVYTLAYGNASAVPLASATLTDTLPANVSFVSCSGGVSCANASGTVTWSLGTLAAGASGTATLTVTVGSGYVETSLANVATLSALTPGGLSVQNSATTTISVTQPVPLYSLTASASVSMVAPSGSVTWTLAYGNPGTGAAAGTLLIDTLPDGFDFTSCSVAGSLYLTSCANQNGTVTFSGLGGAAVTLPAGASGTVTVTAAAAATPFTYANPAVDRATLSGAAGVAAATATASVGVTGQYCSNVFYFHRGTDNLLPTLRPANTTAPTSVTAYSTVIASVTNGSFGTGYQVAFLQETAFAQSTDLSGQTATVNFNLGAVQGGTNTQVVLQRVSSGGATSTLATSGTLSVAHGQTWYTYSFTVPGGTVMATGDKLQWLFQFANQGGTKDITFYYDSTTYNSRSSFCVPSAPASLALTDNVDKTAIAGTPAELLTYTLTASNLGGTAAANVVLTGTLASGMTGCEYSLNGSTWASCSSAGASPPSHAFSLGSLAAGASTTVYVHGSSPATPSSSSLANQATLSGTGLTSASATASTAVTSLRSGGTPTLVVTALADRGTVSPGQTVTYTIDVVNVGTAPATNVTVTDVLPVTSWYGYVASSAAGGTSRSLSGNTLSWTISSLSVGASTSLQFQMRANGTGLPDGLTALADTASAADAIACTGWTPPAGCTSNTVTVLANGSADLGLSGSASPLTVSPGAVLGYTLLVESTGSSTATGVVLAAPLAPHTRFRRVTQGSGAYDAVGNRVVFDVGSLASGVISTLGFEVDVDSTLPAGTTALSSTSTVSASNAQQRSVTVTATGSAAIQLEVSSGGPASLPGPAARLTAQASSATAITVDTSAHLGVGGSVLVGGAVSRITGISGNTVTVDPTTPVTAASGAPLYRSAPYAVSTANRGTATTNAVVLGVQVPSGWAYVSASPTPTSAPAVGGSGTVTWNKGSVAAGSIDAVQLVLIPTVTATLTSSLSDPGQCVDASTAGCSATTATLVGGLTATVMTTTPVVSAGGAASYTITLTNSLGTAIGGVTVVDLLPSGFQYLAPETGTPAPSSVASGQPTWSGLTVPANGSLQLAFQATVADSTGSGTYDDPIAVTAGAGTGVTPFDALSTIDDDVTVLNAGWNLTAGYVFLDRAPLASFDAADTGFEDVAVTIDDGSGQSPFLARTDGFGYFRQLVPGGGTWSVAVPADLNASALAAYSLHSSYASPTSVDVTTAAASELRFGYVPNSGITQYTVNTVVGTGGSVSPTSTLVDYGSTTSFTITPAAGHSIQSVSGCGGTLVGTTYTTGTITANCSVTASFSVNPPESITVVGGGDQATLVTTAFEQPLAVLVSDVGGQPVSGASVTFTAPASGPSATVTTVVATDENGLASTSAIANVRAGTFMVVASVSGVLVPASFALENLAGPAISLQRVSGSGQSTRIETGFSQPLVVRALDANDNPVPYALVTFTPPASSPSALLTPSAPVATDRDGLASVSATADGAPGAYAVTASILTGQQATFSLTNTSTDPFVLSAISGRGQTAAVGSPFANPLVARVTQNGFPVAGAAVTFAPPASGASAALSATTVFTDADGYAQVLATATTVSGAYQVRASCPQASADVSFAETNAPDAPAALVLASASSPQATTVGTSFAHTLLATLVDGHGNPVPGVRITFTIPASGASAVLGAGEATSDTDGQVTVTAAANDTPGSYVVDASAPGVPKASFELTNLFGAPAFVTAVSGTPQTATVGTAFAHPLVARVADLYGNPIPGVEVTWSAPASSATATVEALSAITDADGLAEANATAGARPGRYDVAASVPDGAAPALFVLTNGVGAPVSLTADPRTTPQSADVGTPFSLPLRAHLADVFGNPAPGVTVTYTVSATEPTALLSVRSTTTDENGDASIEAVAGTTAGAYPVSASVVGLTPVSFALTNLAVATPPTALEIRSGADQTTVATTAYAAPLVLRVRDAGGAPVAGVTVHLVLPASGPSATAPETAVVSDAQGEVRFTLTALEPLGTFTVTASADGAATPITSQFTVTVIPTVTTVQVTPSNARLSDTVTLQAHVSSDHGTPPGAVTFTLDGADVATVPLTDGAASTTLAASRIGLGAHSVVARYAGAEPFAPSASPEAPLAISAGRDYLDGGGGCASGGGSSGGLTLALLAAAWVLRRRRKAGVLVALVAVLSGPARALAQSTPAARSPGAAVNQFSSAPAGSDWAGADSLRYGDGRLAVRALLDYARRPLVIYHADGSARRVVISSQFWLHAGASLVVLDRLRLSLTVPVAIHQSPISSEYNGERIEPTRSSGLGDLALGVDVLLLGAPQGATRFGAGVNVLLPTGAQRGDLGDGHVGAALHVNGAGRVRRIEWAAEAGYAYRSGARIGDARFESAVRGKAAAGARLLDGALLIGPEVYVGKGVGASSGAARHLAIEGVASARVRIADRWSVHIGVGTGIKRAAGIPDWRALTGVQWTPGASLANEEQPEAPQPAADGDGGRAPEQPAAPAGNALEQRPDLEGGLADAARDMGGAAAPEVRSAPSPAEAPPEEKAPPQVHGADPAQLASLAGTKIVTLQPVHFPTDKAIIEPRSFALLADVGTLLLEHPEIARVRVEGHTDLQGARAHNVDLSQRRAQAVVDFLAGKGFPRERLEARGFGPDRPIADNRSAEGRAANRRVEFIVLDATEPPATPP
jgi:uncharacterized repeat protein (TIGR01451 family)/MYXO-CTERM domain-containing protein